MKIDISIVIATIIVSLILFFFSFNIYNFSVRKDSPFKPTKGQYNYTGYVKAAEIEASLGKTKNTSILEIKKKDHIVRFNQNLKNPTISQKGKTVIYKDSQNNNEYHYKITKDGVKEDIILKTKQDIQNVFIYQLELNHLSLKRGWYNSYHFIDNKTNRVVFSIPKPYMTDANDTRSEDIEVYFRQRNGQDYLELIADEKWLKDPKRKFPIIIDPTIISPPKDIGIEDISKRTLQTKTYSLGKGKYAAVSDHNPIHYQNENGNWQEIDTSIIPSSDPNYDFMNITNNFKTYFRQTDNKTNIKFQVQDAYLVFNTINNIAVNHAVKNNQQPNKIKYPKNKSQAKSIEAEYSLEQNRLLEELIVDSPDKIPPIKQLFQIKNAYPRINNKAIDFYHLKTNKLLWSFPEPVMYELYTRIDPQTNQSSRFENYDLYYQITCQDNNKLINDLTEKQIKNCHDFILEKIIDQKGNNWLNDPSRVYPVVIDASVGPNSGATFATDSSSGGSVDWSNPGEADASDDSWATTTALGLALTGDYTTKLIVGGIISGDDKNDNYSFLVGDDEYYSYGGSTDTWGLTLDSDDVNSSNFGFATSHTGDMYISYFLKATNFGFNIPTADIDGIIAEVEAATTCIGKFCMSTGSRIDHIIITVYYSESGPTNTPTPTPTPTNTPTPTPTNTPTPTPTPTLPPHTDIEGLNIDGVNIN